MTPTDRTRVYFYEAFEEEAAEIRAALAASDVGDRVEPVFTWKTVQEEHAAMPSEPPAPIISIRTQSEMPVSWASSVRGIINRATGFDHVLAYREASGVEVPAGSLPLYCNRAVAEQAMMMWMMLLRKANQQQRQFRGFHRDGITGAECAGKRLLVVGVGYIGSEIAKIGTGLEMHVEGFDRSPRFDVCGYTDDADAAIARADVIACAMDLNASSRGFFDADRVGRAERSPVFVNISRGEISPSTVLLGALDRGVLSGVGLDVYDHERELAAHLRQGEPIPEGSVGDEVRAAIALAERDDAVVTPHNAFNAQEAVDRKAGHAVRQLESLLTAGSFKWPITSGTAR